MRKTLSVLGLATVLALGAVATAFAVTSQIGNEASNRGLVDTYSNFTIVDTNNPAPFDGVFHEITYYAGAARDVRFVIVDSSDQVTWVSPVVTPPSTGLHTVTFDGPVGVTTGSNLGVYSVGFGAISWQYASEASPAEFEGNNAGLPTVGDTLDIAGTSGRYYSMNATITATSPEICKDGGWESYGYRNQGQCIASVVANDNAGK